MLGRILSFFFMPFFRVVDPYVTRVTDGLRSPKTQRAAVKSLFIGIACLTLLSVALMAYVAFYAIYVPRISHSAPVYLQYGKDAPPTAHVGFIDSNTPFLTGGQAYIVSVSIAVPDSERNSLLGNFMVDVDLRSRNETGSVSVIHESRPAILAYQSPFLRVLSTMWRLFPLLMGYSQENQFLKVVMFEQLVENSAIPITSAVVSVSNRQLDTYSMTIHLDADFKGLRYFMYYHKISTAMTFMSIFLFWEIVFSVLAWRTLVAWAQRQAQLVDKPPVPTDNANGLSGPASDSRRGGRADELGGGEWGGSAIPRGDPDASTTSESENETSMSRASNVAQRAMSDSSRAGISGTTSYTDSYVTDEESQSVLSGPEYGGLPELESEGDGDDFGDETEGSITPTSRSRRSTVSGISTATTTDDEYDDERLPVGAATGRSPISSTRAYTRRVPGSGVNDSTEAVNNER